MRHHLLLLCVTLMSAELRAQPLPSASPPPQNHSWQASGESASKGNLRYGTTQPAVAPRPFVVQCPPTSSGLTPVLITFTATMLAALLGIFGKYRYDLRIAQRKDRLERINTQLRLLYGPLYATDLASRAVWRAFWQKLNVDPKAPRNQWRKLSPQELAEWRTWVIEVFMPLNERMESAIVENADLFETGEIPEGLLKLCAHVAAYKALRANWNAGNYEERSPLINYPAAEFREHVQETFRNLRAEQAQLLARVRSA